jgi:hypothetical protein
VSVPIMVPLLGSGDLTWLASRHARRGDPETARS